MVHLLQRILIGAGVAALALTAASTRKFYPDDPLLKAPRPLPVGKLKPDKISDAGDFVHNTLLEPGQKQSRTHPTPSLDVNTIDELPDNAWYANRDLRHLSAEDLSRGADGTKPPSTDKPWTIYQAKLEGVTPGFRIKDGTGERYVIKFDPKDNIEMATAADVIGSKLFHALGYNVPDNYPVRFRREQLRLGENIKFSRDGHEVEMEEEDLDHLLSKAPRYPDGSYRGVASRFIPGDILGPFQYYGTRKDDPNDTIAHERLRVLRGLYVFCAWVDHTDSRAINTLDTIQQVDGVRAVRHYLIDFGAILGSDSLIPKQPWHGHTYTMDFKWGLRQVASLGFYSADWERRPYRYLPSVGKYEADTFEPDAWKPSYPNPAFDNRTAADDFWAAKHVMAFSDDQLRALAATGGYSNPAAADAVARVLIARRDKIGHYYFSKVLPLDQFSVSNGELTFHDWGGNGHYTVAWSRFDNGSGTRTALPGESSFHVPAAAGYLAADIGDGAHKITVYINGGKVVGAER